jgi:hypothetical protein
MVAEAPLPPQALARIERIRRLPSTDSPRLVSELLQLTREAGLAAALRALFRQQVEAGYVLFDPAEPTQLAEKSFPSHGHGPAFRLQWNPQRELRLNHALLIERGVIASNVDQNRLINRDTSGKGCYLCQHNIAIQSPAEVVLPLTLNGEAFILGSNFAPITDNHFTVIPGEHRPQHYHIGILQAGFELAAATGGSFRVLFNGRAGASILGHEHLHATNTRLPVEALTPDSGLHLYRRSGLTISQPDYPLPLWLIEGDAAAAVAAAGDRLITAWQRLNQQRHSENLLLTFEAGRYRLFIAPRDLSRLTAPGRTAAMGSFETAGLLVLSHKSEKGLFDHTDAATMQQLLVTLTPECPIADAFQASKLGF